MNKHIEKKLDEIDALQEELRNVPEGESGYTRRIEIYQRITELMKEVRTDVSSIYQRGREDLQKEIAHEQRKLLDGFAHPKDCPQCSPLPEYPRE